jgi:hypothetical protein
VTYDVYDVGYTLTLAVAVPKGTDPARLKLLLESDERHLGLTSLYFAEVTTIEPQGEAEDADDWADVVLSELEGSDIWERSQPRTVWADNLSNADFDRMIQEAEEQEGILKDLGKQIDEMRDTIIQAVEKHKATEEGTDAT